MEIIIVALLAASCFIAFPAQAQIPASVEPARVQEDIKRKKALYRIPPPIEAESGFSDAPPGAENILFVVTDIQVDGVNALPMTYISKLYRDRLGREISVGDLYAVANEITRHYRDKGFLFYKKPF